MTTDHTSQQPPREPQRGKDTMGERIGNLRRARGLSQDDVAERLGVSRQAVSKWETDLSAPDTYNLIALGKLFDSSIEYIALGTERLLSVQAASEETRDEAAALSEISDDKGKTRSENAETFACAASDTSDAPRTGAEAPPAHGGSSQRKNPRWTVGLMLIGVGLVSTVLGFLFPILFIPAAYFMVTGIVLLCTVNRPTSFAIIILSCCLYAITSVVVLFITGSFLPIRHIQKPDEIQGGATRSLIAGLSVSAAVIISWLLYAWLLVNAGVVIGVIVRAWRRKQASKSSANNNCEGEI
ncbi:MAG: helix-turn-helix domain-containing protein [Clostridia bacterium]|nr:helix-turn-helix domain-containing protein [Clostridia bacterium]